jgi:leucyl aminopeptidase
LHKSLAFFTGLFCALLMSASALAQTNVHFLNSSPMSGNIVLGIHEDGELGSFAGTIDGDTNGGLSHILKASGFSGKAQTTKLVPAPMGSDYAQILLVGLGAKDGEISDLILQKIGGNAVQKAVTAFKVAPPMIFDVSPEVAAHIAYGAKLGSYYFDKYYTAEKRHKSQESLTIVTNDSTSTSEFYLAELDPVANAMWHTRDISNEPANVIYPESFVERWSAHFEGMENVTIKIIDENEMLERGMGAIYGVGRGSTRPPRMMIIEYMGGDEGDNPVVIVGKGITFDSGGISLKNPLNMWNQKFDMSGAASAIGTVHALAGRGAKINAVGIAALAENMPGANAQRPGDVVKSLSGKTIQIRSTDAEGRLVLADAMYYGDMTYNPPLLVDMATLTGAARGALGADYGALFSRHDDLAEKLFEMGKITGDDVWRLPLNDKHFKAIQNNVADVMNSGPSAPGASAGAAFVGTFVRDTTNWLHLDYAGIAYSDVPSPTKSSPGSRAFGVRLLNGFIKKYYEEK